MSDEAARGAAPDGRPDGAPPYPHSWEADVVLSDGSVGRVRPIVPDDAAGLHRFHEGQSEESIYLRFFAPIKRLADRDVHRFTHVDHHERVALVVLIRREIAGIGRFDRIDGHDGVTAEVAFNVADRHRGVGIGSVLLEHLADVGREIGVRRFVADVLPQNRRMINVFRDAGYEVNHEFDDGVIAVSFDLEPTDASRGVQLSREHRAEAVSVRRLLRPRSVAVVGVSRAEGSVGRTVFRNLRAGGFTGPLHAVNRHGGSVDGEPVATALADLEPPIDLVVVAVPAPEVPGVVQEAAAIGVGAVVVVSSGFAEAGREGELLQDELLSTVRANGMRLLGPNSFGVMSTRTDLSLNASLSPRTPGVGGLGLFAQSAAMSVTELSLAELRGLGISTFASAGNRADISGNDLMQYWIDDDDTDVVGLYLESMGNPRKFSRIARQLASIKPVIVVTSGFTRYGAPRGHRVRRAKAPPEALDAMLRQAGVIRVPNLHQLYDVAQLLLHQPLPRGDRVAVVTNSEALSALAADTVLAGGLKVARRPVALAGTASVDDVHAALDEALADDGVDALVVAFIPPALAPDPEVVATVERVAAGHDKPVVATFPGMRGVRPGGTLPTYPLPEDAIRSLVAALRYAQWRDRVQGEPVRPDGINRRAAHDVVETALAQRPQGRQLDPQETETLLTAYGIEVWPARPVTSADDAARAATALGLPAVVKATSDLVRHQPGQQWVRIGLRTQSEVAAAYEAISTATAALGVEGVAVQAQAPTGVPVAIASVEDPLFGPVLSFGVAGLPSELLDDVAYRFPPLTGVDVAELVTSVRAAPLFLGYRGTSPVDLAALHDLLARVSVLADDLPEVASLQLNPVMAHEHGVAVLGARVQVARTKSRTDLGRRSLRREMGG